MKSERLKKAAEIFHATLEREPDTQAQFLAEACGADTELLAEVQSLLAAHHQSSGFLDSPAYDAQSRLPAESNLQFEVGTSVGHYRIVSLLGRGGMGEVYLAQDTRLHRRVALKLLRGSLTRDKQRVKRFEQEACSASALSHPNILTVHDVGQEGGSFFIATEYIDGETLRQAIKRGKLTLGLGIEIAIQVSAALAAAHDAGIVHRDIKPENIMLRPDGYVKVLDFGLAKLSAPLDPQAIASSVSRLNTELGMVMGTVNYMSPEQARGKQVDARSDIFSLGIVFYEMITGRVPFAGETASDVIAAILEKEPAPLIWFWPNVPSELQRIISKTLRKDRDERYQTIKDLLLDLKSLKRNIEFEAKLEHELAPEISEEVIASRRSGQTLGALARRHSAASGQIPQPAIPRGRLLALIRQHALKSLMVLGFVFLGAVAIVYFSTRAKFGAAATVTPSPPKTSSAIVHWWSFDEVSGNALDSGASASPVTATLGADVKRIPGRSAGNCALPGGAIELNGKPNSYLSLETGVGQFGKKDFTVSLWIKTEFTQVYQREILSNRAVGSHGNYFSLRFGNTIGSGRIDYSLGQGVTSAGSGINFFAILSKRTGLNDNKWHQIVMVRQGLTGKLFIDGQIDTRMDTLNNGTDIRVDDGVTNISNGTPLLLGNSEYSIANNRGSVFEGAIDEVQIFDRALGDEEVSKLFGGLTVDFGACNSNVDNHVLATGCTLNEMVGACRSNAQDQRQFINCVARLANDWVASGIITPEEKDRISRCAESAPLSPVPARQ